MIKRLIWTIWTRMSSVLKKADKLNLSLSLSCGTWGQFHRKCIPDMSLKILSAKYLPFCSGLNVLNKLHVLIFKYLCHHFFKQWMDLYVIFLWLVKDETSNNNKILSHKARVLLWHWMFNVWSVFCEFKSDLLIFVVVVIHSVSSCNNYWTPVSNMTYFDGLVQNCSISIANAPEILQFCTKPSISFCFICYEGLTLGTNLDLVS